MGDWEKQISGVTETNTTARCGFQWELTVIKSHKANCDLWGLKLNSAIYMGMV